MVFTKLGTVAVTSQLDLTRNLPRVLRRAGVPLKYSEGFSPKAVLSYGPALPLGIYSVAEVLDVTTLVDLEPEALLALLEPVADPGLRFLRAARLPDDSPACARVAKLAEYVAAAPGWTTEQLEEAVQRALGATPIEVVAVRKKGPRTIDVRDGLLSMAVDVPNANEQAALGLAADSPLLRWRVDLDQGAHVRAYELCRGLLGDAGRPEGWIGARVALWGLRKGQVFDLLRPDERLDAARHTELGYPTASAEG